MKHEILRLESVTTKKDDVTLLNHFNLHLFQGEITGLVCLNTTGRESLLELIRQNVPIHYGRIYFNGELVNHYQHSPFTANKVAVIARKYSLIDDLTVAENIFVLRRGLKKFLIHTRTLNEQVRRFTEPLGLAIDGSELVANLTPYEKYVVELLRAVAMGAKLIVVKDVSISMSAAELSSFHAFLKYYCGQGFSFLYICNHHEEAFAICDRMCLMRDGKIVKKLDKKEFINETIVPYYIREYSHIEKVALDTRNEKGILTFRNVSTENLDSMTFTIVKGECTVLLDMDHTALADIMRLLNGELRPNHGNILLDEELYTENLARHAIAHGVAFIQENPTETMLFKEMSYIKNLVFLIDKKRNPIRINKRMIKSVIREYEPIVGKEIHENHLMNLKTDSLYNLIYYRIHLCNPKLVICVQPFAGADLHLRLHIIALIHQLKRKGVTVVIAATNIADSLVIADKLILLEKGRFSAAYSRSEFHLFRSASATAP